MRLWRSLLSDDHVGSGRGDSSGNSLATDDSFIEGINYLGAAFFSEAHNPEFFSYLRNKEK
jgi:hypothetical protein